MTVTLYEEDRIENLDQAIEVVKQRHALRLAAKRSQLAALYQTLTEKFPEKFKEKFKELEENTPVSVTDHRKALRNAMNRNFQRIIEHGLHCFTMTCDTDPRDKFGNPEDESGSYMARLKYCQALLNAGGLSDVLIFDRDGHGLLVVVI